MRTESAGVVAEEIDRDSMMREYLEDLDESEEELDESEEDLDESEDNIDVLPTKIWLIT